MTQIATVERLLAGDYAVISVPRKSACGHDCEECAGCGVTGAAVQARAANPIGAKPGQKVVVQSDTQKMLGIVALVYLTPVVLFLVGYFATIAVASAPIRYLFGGIGFVLGILIAVAYDRRLRRQGGLRFTIVRLF
ncbi:SoxR reducing system RseC family protein [Dysosmobacter sp.]|uniref:SoxR reducing system RseC family protein n=1 Tax=Dysosmobacter sp. TaxID=2591382 RepID=UPI001BB480FF|nr:SoxR reducing system RseC family protein [Dysosmobacter sp. Marseille-Q4140]